MDTTHRKIELQSPADLTYLMSNATKAAREKIDLHFPPSAAPTSGEDDMKKRVEELVDAYITQTFEGVKQNLEINGLQGERMEEALRQAERSGEELEPYDTRLASRILKTSSQIEALTLQLANLRRTAPAQAAAAYTARQAAQDEAFVAVKAEEERRLIEAAKDVRTGAEDVRRWQEMRGRWGDACDGLVGTKKEVGGTVARLGRARDVVGVLDG